MKKRLPVVCRVCLFAFFANFVLFGVKLYIGLSANSISIFSDAVNNLFDALGGLVSFAGLFVLTGEDGLGMAHTVRKAEQLFSFLISIVICLAGGYFAYSSLERLMYPSPVWFTPLGLCVLIATAAAKLGMFAFYRHMEKKEPSPVIRVMRMDCVLDFFITGVAVLTLVVSRFGRYSIDAIAGLVISVMIVVPAVKTLLQNGAALIDRVPAEKRATFREIFAAPLAEGEITQTYFTSENGEVFCHITCRDPQSLAEKSERPYRETGMKLIWEEELWKQQ